MPWFCRRLLHTNSHLDNFKLFCFLMATFMLNFLFFSLNYTPLAQRTLKSYMIRSLFLFRCFVGKSSHKYAIIMNNSESSVNVIVVLRIIYSTRHGWAVKCKPLHVKRSLYGTWYTLNMTLAMDIAYLVLYEGHLTCDLRFSNFWW